METFHICNTCVVCVCLSILVYTANLIFPLCCLSRFMLEYKVWTVEFCIVLFCKFPFSPESHQHSPAVQQPSKHCGKTRVKIIAVDRLITKGSGTKGVQSTFASDSDFMCVLLYIVFCLMSLCGRIRKQGVRLTPGFSLHSIQNTFVLFFFALYFMLIFLYNSPAVNGKLSN